MAGRIPWFYAANLLWPGKLIFIYPRWQIDAAIWWQYLFPSAAITVIVVLWLLRSRIGRGPLVAVLFFVGSLFPVLGFFDVYMMRYSYVSDHWQYLPSLALIVLAATCGSLAASRLGKPGKSIGSVIAIFILGTFAVLTWQQTYIYKDLETLWRDTLAKNPNAGIAHINWGGLLASQGKIDEAISHYHQALKIKPDDPEALYNMGTRLFVKGKIDEAISHYRRALQFNPHLAKAHINLGIALSSQGDGAEALSCFRKAIKLNPDNAEAYSNLATELSKQGKVKEAANYFHRALQINPQYIDAHNNLGHILTMQGKAAEAIPHFRQVVQLNPQHLAAHNSLAWILATHRDAHIRQPNEALQLAHRACRLTQYKNPSTLDTLSAAYANAGQFDRAINTAQKAINLATAAKNQTLADLIKKHLELYKQGKPYREP